MTTLVASTYGSGHALPPRISSATPNTQLAQDVYANNNWLRVYLGCGEKMFSLINNTAEGGKISGASSAVGGGGGKESTLRSLRSNQSLKTPLPDKMSGSTYAAYQHKRKVIAKWLPVVLSRFKPGGGAGAGAKAVDGSVTSASPINQHQQLLGLRGLSVPFAAPFHDSKSMLRSSFADLFTLSEDYNNKDNADIDEYEGDASVSSARRRIPSSASLNSEFSKFSSLAILYAEMYYHDDLTLDVEPSISSSYFWNDKQSVVIVTADTIYVFGSIGELKAPTTDEVAFCAIAAESEKENRDESSSKTKDDSLNCFSRRKFFEGYYLRRCVPIAAVADFCLGSVDNVVYVTANHEKSANLPKSNKSSLSNLEAGRYYDLTLPAIANSENYQHWDDKQDEPGYDCTVADSEVLIEALAGAKKISRWRIEPSKFSEEYAASATATAALDVGPASLAASLNGRARTTSNAPQLASLNSQNSWDAIVKNAQSFTERLKYRLTSQYSANGAFSAGNIPSAAASTVGGATATLSAKSSIRLPSNLSTPSEVQHYWNVRLAKLSINGPSLADIPFRSQFHIQEKSVVLPPQPLPPASPLSLSVKSTNSASSPTSKGPATAFPTTSPTNSPLGTVINNFSMNIEPLLPLATYNDLTCAAISVKLCRDLTQNQLGIAVAASKGFTAPSNPSGLPYNPTNPLSSDMMNEKQQTGESSAVTFAGGDEALRREIALLTENNKRLEAEKNEIIRSSRGSFASNTTDELDKARKAALEMQKQIRELEKESSDLQAENDKIKKQMSLAAISVARQNKDIQTFVDDFVEDIDEHWTTSVGHMIKFRSHVEEALEKQLASLVGQKNYAHFSPTSPVPLTFPATDYRRRIMTTDAVNNCWGDLVEANDRCRDKLKEMLRDSVVRLPLVEIDGINDDIDDLTAQATFVTNVQPKSGSSADFGDEAVLDRVMSKYSEIKESLAVATRMIREVNDQQQKSIQKEFFVRVYFSTLQASQAQLLRQQTFATWARYASLRREIKKDIAHGQTTQSEFKLVEGKLETVQKQFDSARAEIGALEDENDKLRAELETESSRILALKQNSDSLMEMHKDMSTEMEVRVRKEQETEERLRKSSIECEELRKRVSDLTRSLDDAKHNNEILSLKASTTEKQLEGSLGAVEEIKKQSYAARTALQKLELDHAKTFLEIVMAENADFVHSILLPSLKNIQFMLVTTHRNRAVNDQISEARTRTIQDQFIIIEGELGEAAKRISFLEESIDAQRKLRDTEAEQFRTRLMTSTAESDKLRLDVETYDHKSQLLQRRVTELEDDARERLESQKQSLNAVHSADLQIIEKQLHTQKIDMDRLRADFDAAMEEREDILAREAKLQTDLEHKSQELTAAFDIIKDLEKEMEAQSQALVEMTHKYTTLNKSLTSEHEKISEARKDLDKEIEMKRTAIDDERKRLNTRIFADASTEIDEQIMSPEAQRYETRIIDLQDDIRGLTHDLQLSAARENVLFNENATFKHDLAEAKTALDEAVEQMMEAEEDRSYMQVQVEKEKIALDEVAEWDQMTREFFFHTREKLLVEEAENFKAINTQLEEHIRGLVDETSLLTDDMSSINTKFEASEAALATATEQIKQLEEKVVEFEVVKATAETAATFKEKWIEERTAHKALQEDKEAADEAAEQEKRELITECELKGDTLNARIMELAIELEKAGEIEDANKLILREELEVSRRQNVAASSQYQAQLAILNRDKTVSQKNISRLKRETQLMKAVLQDYEISEDEYALEEDEEDVESDDESENDGKEEADVKGAQKTAKPLSTKRRKNHAEESSPSPSPSRSVTNTTMTAGDDFYRTGTTMTTTTLDGLGPVTDDGHPHESNAQFLRTRAKMAVVMAKGKSHKFLRGALLSISLDRLMLWMKQWEELVFIGDGSGSGNPLIFDYLKERDELVMSSAQALLSQKELAATAEALTLSRSALGTFSLATTDARKIFEDCQKEIQNQRTEQQTIHHANELAKIATENYRLEDELNTLTNEVMKKSTSISEHESRQNRIATEAKILWEDTCVARKNDIATSELETRAVLLRLFDQQKFNIIEILERKQFDLDEALRLRDEEYANHTLDYESQKEEETQQLIEKHRKTALEEREAEQKRHRQQQLHLQQLHDQKQQQIQKHKDAEEESRRDAERLRLQDIALREKELQDKAAELERVQREAEKERELASRERELKEKELFVQQRLMEDQHELREEQRAQEADRARSREVLEMLVQQQQQRQHLAAATAAASATNFSRLNSVMSIRNESHLINGPEISEIEKAIFPPSGSGVMDPPQLVQLLLHMNNEKAKQVKISETASQIGDILKASYLDSQARKEYLQSGQASVGNSLVSPHNHNTSVGVPPHAAMFLGQDDLNNPAASEAAFSRMMSTAGSRNSFYRIGSQMPPPPLHPFQRATSALHYDGDVYAAVAATNMPADQYLSNPSASTPNRARSISPNSSNHIIGSGGRYATNNNLIPISAITTAASSPAPSTVQQQAIQQQVPQQRSVSFNGDPSPEQVRLSQRIAAVIMEEQLGFDSAQKSNFLSVAAPASGMSQTDLDRVNGGSVNQRLSYSRASSGNKLPSATSGRSVTRNQLF